MQKSDRVLIGPACYRPNSQTALLLSFPSMALHCIAVRADRAHHACLVLLSTAPFPSVTLCGAYLPQNALNLSDSDVLLTSSRQSSTSAQSKITPASEDFYGAPNGFSSLE